MIGADCDSSPERHTRCPLDKRTEAHTPETPEEPPAKRKRGRPKQEAKAQPKAKAQSAKAGTTRTSSEKACELCKKKGQEFWPNQNKCVDCLTAVKSLTRTAQAQGFD
eukprot:794736-Amphidinium_carterae.1